METRLLTQHLKARFYYYFNFTAGYKQSDGGPKHSLTLGVQDMTVILHSTPCAASTAPPTCCGSKRPKHRASHQAQRKKAAHHDRLSVTGRANLVVAQNTEAPGWSSDAISILRSSPHCEVILCLPEEPAKSPRLPGPHCKLLRQAHYYLLFPWSQALVVPQCSPSPTLYPWWSPHGANPRRPSADLSPVLVTSHQRVSLPLPDL